MSNEAIKQTSDQASALRILAIDPGPLTSGFVELSDGKPTDHGIITNDQMLQRLRMLWKDGHNTRIAIEMISSYGMPVGREVFETCVFIGRCMEAARTQAVMRITRGEVKLHICGTLKAKDPHIRQAMLDRFGPQGTKKAPGATFGMAKDVWAALALGATAYDLGIRPELRLK